MVGRVKIASHIETGQKAAVKIIPKQALKPKKDKNPENTDPNKDEAIINKKLEREIAIMKLIQHPSIMALYDVYESPDDLYVSAFYLMKC
jgi:serine/threonine protein kinase